MGPRIFSSKSSQHRVVPERATAAERPRITFWGWRWGGVCGVLHASGQQNLAQGREGQETTLQDPFSKTISCQDQHGATFQVQPHREPRAQRVVGPWQVSPAWRASEQTHMPLHTRWGDVGEARRPAKRGSPKLLGGYQRPQGQGQGAENRVTSGGRENRFYYS